MSIVGVSGKTSYIGAQILNLRTVGEFEQILRGDRGHE